MLTQEQKSKIQHLVGLWKEKKWSEIQDELQQAILDLDENSIRTIGILSKTPAPKSPLQFWAGIHLLRYRMYQAPIEKKAESWEWLILRGVELGGPSLFPVTHHPEVESCRGI